MGVIRSILEALTRLADVFLWWARRREANEPERRASEVNDAMGDVDRERELLEKGLRRTRRP